MQQPHRTRTDTDEVSFFDLFGRHISRRFDKEDQQKPGKPPPPEKPLPTRGLQALMLFPWILGLGFLLSFWWDFDQLALTIFGYTLALDGLMRILTISGLIGFTTNWLAIQMLFYPRKKRPILGQGLIPAQKLKIARRLAVAVERELINPELIKQEFIDNGLLQKYTDVLIWDVKALISNEPFRKDVNVLFEQYLHQALSDTKVKNNLVKKAEELILQSVENNAIERSALKVYLVVKGKTLADILNEGLSSLPSRLTNAAEPINELIDTIPARLRKDRSRLEQLFVTVLSRIIDQINIQKIIEDNINRYDEEKLERIIRDATDTHLNYIKYLGALIGTVGGLIIWNPLLSISFLIVMVLVLWGLDTALGNE